MSAHAKLFKTVLLTTVLVTAQAGWAIVDPTYQPDDVSRVYGTIVAFRVTEIDDDDQTFTLKPAQVCKGKYAVEQVVVHLASEEMQDPFMEVIWQDSIVVAYLDKEIEGRENEILFYPGDGYWQGAVRDAGGKTWKWTEHLEPEMPGNMFGTFNGQPERLAEMMADEAKGCYYYPATAFARFRPDLAVGKLDGPARGVALYDLDGDGRLDVYACSEKGNKAFVQAGKLRFEDATDRLGLAGIAGRSVSLADANADGKPDLMCDGAIYLASGSDKSRRFTKCDALPAEAAENVKLSAFVELNGDGYPDAVVSKVGGGLHVYLNPGAAGGAFTDATADLGLDAEQAGAGGNGFFAPGLWDEDARTDLFYAVGKGLFLARGETGDKFAPVASRLQIDFKTGGQAEGLTGAGCFAPLWQQNTWDLVCTSQASLNVVSRMDGKPRDITGFGNEITECTGDMLGVVAEDLNADGIVDIYATSRTGLPNMFYVNRGYGSFAVPSKRHDEVLAGAVHRKGGWGVAAGDANNDGANDLLIAGLDGTVTLLVNDVLARRHDRKRPTWHEKKLAAAKIVTIRVRGKLGVLGAVVQLADAQGSIIGQRIIGANVSTGCRGPDDVNLVVREVPTGADGKPTPLALTIRWGDGKTRESPVVLPADKRRVVIEAPHE